MAIEAWERFQNQMIGRLRGAVKESDRGSFRLSVLGAQGIDGFWRYKCHWA